MPPEVDAPPQPTATPQPATPAPTNGDWRSYVTPELQADPVVKGWAEKASEKDIPALIKGYAHTFSKLGSAINLPGKDAKPEELSALRAKLMDAGVIPSAPGTPKDYGLTKIEQLPEGLQWNGELADKFAGVLHKHGIPKAALDEMLPLYMEALTGNVKTLQVDREQALAKLKSEHGEKYDERVEAVKRIANGIFQTPEEMQFFEDMNLGDHPGFLSVMLRLAPLAMQDSSFMDSLPHAGGEMSGDSAKAELAKIMSDSTHPHYAGFKRIPMDPATDRYVTDLYKRAYGNVARPQESVSAG